MNRLYQWYSLLFLLVLSATACNNKHANNIHLIWNQQKAIAVSIPTALFPPASNDSMLQYLKVYASNDTAATAILGTYKVDTSIVFEPILPFTQGSAYTIVYRKNKIASFNIPAADSSTKTILKAIYPNLDTLPVNLLKVYLQFSAPMQEGQSAKYIKLIRNKKDTLENAFLDLQPELWNEDRTVLTLWLDPGRIKRGLQPNLALGAPLEQKNNYELVVAANWRDARGVTLQKSYRHYFITGARDSLSPNPTKWTINIVSSKSIVIDLHESLDHFLLAESLYITNDKGAIVNGNFTTNEQDNICSFTPAEPLMPRKYNLHILTKLEDLAGNNINKPFDREINSSKKINTEKEYIISFRVGHFESH